VRRAFPILVAASLLGALSLGAASAAPSLPTSESKTCPPGYVHADLSWGEKCLRAGEFCKVGNPEYHQYGFDCPPSGHLVAYSASSPAKPGSSSTPTHPSSAAACGVERWTVKTLQDRPALLPVRAATIAYLVSRPAPHPLPVTRLPFERNVFRVTAAVTLDRPEADGDLHLVLTDGTHTMIAESASPACTTGAMPARRTQMAHARMEVSLCSRAIVTGVAFFDFKHGQTGVAPNAIELHPVLAFRCLLP
jgi:hypothetical protein